MLREASSGHTVSSLAIAKGFAAPVLRCTVEPTYIPHKDINAPKANKTRTANHISSKCNLIGSFPVLKEDVATI